MDKWPQYDLKIHSHSTHLTTGHSKQHWQRVTMRFSWPCIPCSLWLSWVGSWSCRPVGIVSVSGCGAPGILCSVCRHSTRCPGYGCTPKEQVWHQQQHQEKHNQKMPFPGVQILLLQNSCKTTQSTERRKLANHNVSRFFCILNNIVIYSMTVKHTLPLCLWLVAIFLHY